MKIKSVLYILAPSLFLMACSEELEYGKDAGRFSIELPEEKPAFLTNATTRTVTNAGETTWDNGDVVTVSIKMLDKNNSTIGQANSITFTHNGSAWTANGETSIPLPTSVRSVSVEASMSHVYNATSVKGTETMTAEQTWASISPSGIYNETITAWERTSSVIQTVGTTNTITVYQPEETSKDGVSITGEGVFHLTPNTEYILKETKGENSKSYTINPLEAGKWYRYNLSARPEGNPLFDPNTGLPIIPDYPGYIKYTKDGKTQYAVANGEGLNAALMDANGNKRGENSVVTLYDDVDMKNVAYIPVGEEDGYKGTIDGNGYTVSGLNMTTKVLTDNIWHEHKNNNDDTARPNDPEDGQYECAGLVAYLAEGGVIENMTLEDVNINIEGSVPNADMHVGAITSICSGRIENCHVKGNITMTTTPHQSIVDAYNSGRAYSGDPGKYGYDGRIGGITSTLYGTGQIVGCSVTGDFRAESNYNKFTIIGGIAGFVLGNGGEIVACYVNGKITFSTIINDYYKAYNSETGTFTENAAFTANIGGLIGVRESVDRENSYIASYVNLTDDSSLTIECKNNTVTNPEIYKDNYGVLGGMLVKNKAVPTTDANGNVTYDGDIYNAVYWRPTTNITQATNPDNGDLGTDVVQLTSNDDASWEAAVAAMNAAIESYVNGGGVCKWRYQAQSGSSPILIDSTK